MLYCGRWFVLHFLLLAAQNFLVDNIFCVAITKKGEDLHTLT